MYKRLFGERLKTLRKDEGFGIKKISNLIGMSELEYYYLENGYKEPTIKVIAKLSEIFNVTPGYLIVIPTQKTERQKLIEEFLSM